MVDDSHQKATNDAGDDMSPALENGAATSTVVSSSAGPSTTNPPTARAGLFMQGSEDSTAIAGPSNAKSPRRETSRVSSRHGSVTSLREDVASISDRSIAPSCSSVGSSALFGSFRPSNGLLTNDSHAGPSSAAEELPPPDPSVPMCTLVFGPTPAAHNAHNPFLHLPHEILTQIFDACDWPTARRLRQTSHHLREAFPVLLTIRKARVHRTQLLEADGGSFPAPCYGCMRVLDMTLFPSYMWFLVPLERETRRCTTCLLASETMAPGKPYKWRDTEWVRCPHCKQHRERVARFGQRWVKGTAQEQWCGRCRERKAVLECILSLVISGWTWTVLIWCLAVASAVMVCRKVASLWSGDVPYDSGVVSYALFTACYTATIEVVNAIAALLSYQCQYEPLKRRARAWLGCERGLAPFDVFVTLVQMPVVCCIPFAVSCIGTVPILGWVALCWLSMNCVNLARLVGADN